MGKNDGIVLAVLMLTPAFLALLAAIGAIVLAVKARAVSQGNRWLVWVGVVLLGLFSFAVAACYGTMFMPRLRPRPPPLPPAT